jgi:sarcosine oxidase subunit gamma
MAELARSTVAEAIGAPDPVARAPGVDVRLADPGALFYVSEGAPDLAANTVSGVSPYWLWLAPDRALLVGAAELPAGFVSDVTDGLATFEIAGPHAADLVSMGCALDPAGEALLPGRCAQTVFAGAKIVLYRYGARESFRLHVERSLAAYLTAWFQQAAEALS